MQRGMMISQLLQIRNIKRRYPVNGLDKNSAVSILRKKNKNRRGEYVTVCEKRKQDHYWLTVT